MSENQVLPDKPSVLQSVRETVAEYGSTQFNMPGKSSLLPWLRKPPWGHSLGLFHTYKHPEIVMVGALDMVASRVLQDMRERVTGGEVLQPEQEYINFIDYHNCVFRPIDKSHYRNYLEWAISFYGNSDFPALQLVWSDPSGLYPWDPSSQFHREMKGFQPLLFKP